MKKIKYCEFCKSILTGRSQKYCNNTCQFDNQYKVYIENWLIGKETGNKGIISKISISDHVRKWLHEKFNYQCEECGWNKVNPMSNTIPLEVHHIDGNSLNTVPNNLKLLCPNCHSLTSNYRSLNKGNSTRKR